MKSVARAAAPRVSIILPVHNGARFLDGAIRSVLAQTFSDFELICVDDASRDETPVILARHAAADPRVRVLANPANIGLPATLNRGFAAARGALHSWTSDDNLLRPDLLSTLVSALDGAPEAAVAYAGYTVIDAEGAMLRYVPPAPVCQLLTRNVVGAAFLYRAEVTHALHGYDEALFGVEDYDFWLRAARQFRFIAVERDLYRYRRHEGSLTDRREREIKAKLSRLIHREIALTDNRALTARALLSLVLQDSLTPRLGTLARAMLLDPALIARSMPEIAAWANYSLRRRIGRIAGAIGIRPLLEAFRRPRPRSGTTPRQGRTA